MLKQRGEKTADGKWSIPAAERNKDPILGVLARVLPSRGLVLEVASGTGQHVMHFAEALSDLTWQPSDPDAELRESIALRIQEERRANVNWPIDLDVTKLPWPLQTADAVVAINLIHVAPWSATLALFEGAKALLSTQDVLFLYGPYRRFGRHTSQSNAQFDLAIRQRRPPAHSRLAESRADLLEGGALGRGRRRVLPGDGRRPPRGPSRAARR